MNINFCTGMNEEFDTTYWIGLHNSGEGKWEWTGEPHAFGVSSFIIQSILFFPTSHISIMNNIFRPAIIPTGGIMSQTSGLALAPACILCTRLRNYPSHIGM